MNYFRVLHCFIFIFLFITIEFKLIYFYLNTLGFIFLYILDIFMRFSGPFIFIFLLVSIVMVRITTPRMRIETMTRLGWQPMLWLLILVFALYFLGWFMV